jgi:hypothetical protein
LLETIAKRSKIGEYSLSLGYQSDEARKYLLQLRENPIMFFKMKRGETLIDNNYDYRRNKE